MEELGVHNNWTVVDMLFREFYTGADRDLTAAEKEILEELFSTGMATIKFLSELPSLKENLNQVSSVSLLMTSLTALANEGLSLHFQEN